MPPIDHLDTDFLGALQRAGVAPEAVDVVINTHVHSDHVGWNTKRDGDSWVPTFLNARYLIPEADYRFFHPDNAEAAAVTRKRVLTEATRRRAVVIPVHYPGRHGGVTVLARGDSFMVDDWLEISPI